MQINREKFTLNGSLLFSNNSFQASVCLFCVSLERRHGTCSYFDMFLGFISFGATSSLTITTTTEFMYKFELYQGRNSEICLLEFCIIRNGKIQIR